MRRYWRFGDMLIEDMMEKRWANTNVIVLEYLEDGKTHAAQTILRIRDIAEIYNLFRKWLSKFLKEKRCELCIHFDPISYSCRLEQDEKEKCKKDRTYFEPIVAVI